MGRTNRLLSRLLAVSMLGALAPALSGATASAAPAGPVSRPIVWVSGQDTGQVFVTQGTTVLKTFDFVQGTPGNTPVLIGVGGPTPGIAVASPKPHLITFSPDGRFAYVTMQNTDPGKVVVINTGTLKVQTVIDIPNSVNPPLPAGTSPRVTEAKSAPDGTFLFVGSIGPPGVLTKVATDEPTNPTNPTYTVGQQLTLTTGLPAGAGPACSSFSPAGDRAYVDTSLSPLLGVMDVDPATMTVSAVHTTNGDPQCGIHDPAILNGVPTVVVTDNGTGGTVGPPPAPATPGFGHVHTIDTTIPNNFTEVPPSPIPSTNLHDNWPVGLEPAGAPTNDSANTVYGSDRDQNTLHQMLLGTSTDNVLALNDPNVPATPAGLVLGTTFQPRPAIDTLDGSGNTVFAAMKEFGDLGIIDNFNQQTYLHLVTPDPSCGTVGNANFHKCFAVHAVTVQPVAKHGAITVGPGVLQVLRDTTVNGTIVVQPGGSLVLEHSTVTGAVVSVGASSVRICGTTAAVTAPVSISLSVGPVVVGAPNLGCAPNILGGGLSLIKNQGGVEAVGNTTPFVIATGNKPPVIISGNHP